MAQPKLVSLNFLRKPAHFEKHLFEHLENLL